MTNIRICSCRSAAEHPRSHRCPTTICTAPRISNSTTGVEQFARELAGLIPPGANIAVDELTGAMRRAAPKLFPAGPPTDAAIVVGAAQLVKTPDELSCLRKASRITEQAIVDVQQVAGAGRTADRSFGHAGAPRFRTRVPPPTCWRPSGR